MIILPTIETLDQYLAQIEAPQIWVLWDSKVHQLYFNKINFPGNVYHLKVGEGESIKSFQNYQQVMEEMLASGVQRNNHLLAIGGGALSDFAGFVAGTLLRGLKWSIIPTTLLSMVDAAHGGKVGINSRFGKNLIGMFYFPERILTSTEFLKTLDHLQLDSAHGEIIKYALLSPQIYHLINESYPIDELIKACAFYKMELVSNDPHETSDQRILLNFGHSYGHVFEHVYRMPHGLAVLKGIELILSQFGGPRFVFQDLLKKFKLTLPPDKLTIEQVKYYLFKDKKATAKEYLKMITLEVLHQPQVQKIHLSEIENFINEY